MTDSDKGSGNKRGKALPLRRMSREWALQYLYQLDISGEDLNDNSLAWFWRQLSEEESRLGEREFKKCQSRTMKTIEGVLAKLEEIDARVDQEAQNWDIQRMAAVDRNILRIAAYEICYDDDIPVAVSIDEALEICRTFGGGEESRGFINGILDKISRG